MQRVIISGCSGFIGSALTRELIKQGVEVFGLSMHPEKMDTETMQSEYFHLIECSFDEYTRLSEMIKVREFDAFFHMAWEGYGKSTNDYHVQLKNVHSACEAAYAAAALGCKRFIFADSSHEYLTTVNSQGKKGLCSIYGVAKKSARKLCQTIAHNSCMDYIGVLFTNIYGYGDRSNRSTNVFLRKLKRGEDLDLVHGNNLYDWTYIDDCVGGILAAAKRGMADKVYYVGSRQLRPFAEIITEARNLTAPNAKLNFGRYQDNSYIDYSKINIYNLYEDTGYLPTVSFADGINKTVHWLEELDAQSQ